MSHSATLLVGGLVSIQLIAIGLYCLIPDRPKKGGK